MRLKQVEIGESIMLQDGYWKKFGAIVELDNGDNEERAWEIAVKEVERAKKKYLATLPINPVNEIDEQIAIQQDAELQKAKKDLEALEFQEDALAYIKNQGWVYNIELKNIANSKPKKQ